MARLVRRLLPISAPFAALAIVLGCPRESTETTAPAASSSPAPSAAAPSAPAAPSWPKVVVVPDLPPELPELDDASLELGSDADLEIEELDAGLADAPDASDAADADARDTKKVDAYDEAPLLGTKAYPDENPARGIRKITSAAAKVRKAPKGGDVIATLPKGTEVSLVAEIFDWYRVRYSDPNTGQRRQGWVYVVNFAGPRTKTCPLGWTWHPQDGGWCDRECTKNTECKAIKGYKCSGTMCFYAAD